MFKKILIANRGEIAVRIIRACKELGIKAASVYSDADKTLLHAQYADESYNIGVPQSSESYLNQDKIIKLAKTINADAIHPGYGFFAENAEFIKAVEEAGLAFIGPNSKSVAMMGSKTAARKLMSQNNVPIVPGTTEPIESLEEGKKNASGIGYPILLKASAGGGGKGMRLVSFDSEFQAAFEETQRVSLKAFGDDSVYIEKFIEKPKHIEVQIIADKFGNYVHLFERDCSIQRRHQKIIEEAPSSILNMEIRNKITSAAINAAKACNYYNAGTIEFLMDQNKNFYFLEMNTRLQVEHPVTEMITGIDLVKEQISIASGNKISFKQDDIRMNGHAFESRIYAEDFENNFLPSTGELLEYVIPSGPGVRVDNGFGRGSKVSMYYDPLISKLIVWDKDRKSAISRMLRALSEYSIAGVTSNISFLKKIFNHKKFIAGTFDINFIENEFIPSLEKENGKQTDYKLQTIVSIFIAALKEQSSAGNHIRNKLNRDNNKWTELLYE